MSVLFVAASTTTIAMGSGSSALANVNGGTLCAWVKPASNPGGNKSIFGLSNGTAAGSSRMKIGLTATETIRANGRCLDGDANQETDGTAVIATGSWQHLALVFDYVAKIMYLYYNGVIDVTSGTIVGWGAAPTSNTNSLAMNIGSQHSGGSEYFDGYLDDVRCYNRALPAKEILTIYSAGGTDSIAYGLQHRYMLNESSIGAAVPSVAAVVDSGFLRTNGTGTNSPTYSSTLLSYKRRYLS